MLIAISAALFLKADLAIISYFAVIAGLYGAVAGFGIISNGLTKEPLLAGLAYLAFSGTAFLSLPVTHSDNKYLRYLFVIAALVFAFAWLYQGMNFTWGHMIPPPPT